MELGTFVTLATTNLLNSCQLPQREVQLVSYHLGRLQRNVCLLPLLRRPKSLKKYKKGLTQMRKKIEQ